jgi:hypothetical protein
LTVCPDKSIELVVFQCGSRLKNLSRLLWYGTNLLYLCWRRQTSYHSWEKMWCNAFIMSLFVVDAAACSAVQQMADLVSLFHGIKLQSWVVTAKDNYCK